jgi:hypothetical protein
MPDTAQPVLTRGQRRWLEHFRACEARGCSLKDYAVEHGLSVAAAYVAKSELKRRGAWPIASPITLVPVVVSVPPPQAPEQVALRVSLPGGCAVEILAGAGLEHTQAVMHALIGARS